MNPKSELSVIVVQYGARRQYAVPAALAATGTLEALYTDFCLGRGLGRADWLAHRLLRESQIQRLSSRRPPAPVLARTHTFERWHFEMELALKYPMSPEARVRLIDVIHRRAGDRMTRRGFGNATHVLSMFGEGRRYLLEARARGLTVVTDVNIALSAERIVAEEQQINSEWEKPKLYWGQTLVGRSDGLRPTEEMLAASHLFLCPSEFVKEDLEKNYGISKDRTILLPYAVNPRWFTVGNRPRIGRVLFAGAAELRKGIHILAAASDILAQRGRKLEFIVAGAASSMVTSHPRAQSLRFLGRISMPQLRTQFESADIFAFPSLAEGSAGVTYEAMACGLPIVTTRAAGSIARDGIEGRIVSERNSVELADAIEEIVFDRGKRERMSVAARDRAVAYSWQKYQRSLYEALLLGPTSRSAVG